MLVDDDNAGGVCIYFSSYGQSCYKDNKTKLNGTVLLGGVGSVDTVTACLLYVCGLWLCAIGMKNPQRVMPRHGMPFGENGIVSY